MILGLVVILSLLFSCQNRDENEVTFPTAWSYIRTSDSTFVAGIKFGNGKIVTTTYQHKISEGNLAWDKIRDSNIYQGLNWKAQKRYHEELEPVEVIIVDKTISWTN